MAASQENRIPRTPEDYGRAFRDQVELLRSAAKAYDEGAQAQALNLAIRVRTLVHDRGRGTSLLKQLGVKDRLPYLDTALAEYEAPAVVMHAGLCMITASLGSDGASRYTAPLGELSPDRQHPPAAFEDWWNEPVVTVDGGRRFSRADFVLTLANQDGGGHVDPTLGESYAAIARAGVPQFQPAAGADSRLRNLVLPSVRQIAFELDESLRAGVAEDPRAPTGVRLVDPICPLSLGCTVEVGRNDPCPCGSGTKLKHCFGRRQPRRRISLADLMTEAGASRGIE